MLFNLNWNNNKLFKVNNNQYKGIEDLTEIRKNLIKLRNKKRIRKSYNYRH